MWGNLVHVFIVGIPTCSLTRGWPSVTTAKKLTFLTWYRAVSAWEMGRNFCYERILS